MTWLLLVGALAVMQAVGLRLECRRQRSEFADTVREIETVVQTSRPGAVIDDVTFKPNPFRGGRGVAHWRIPGYEKPAEAKITVPVGKVADWIGVK